MFGWEAARTLGCILLMRTMLEMGVWPQTLALHAPALPTRSVLTPGRAMNASVTMASMVMSALMCVT